MKNCNLTNNLILSSLEYGSKNSFFNTTIDSEQVLSLFCVSLFPQDMLHHFLKRGKKEENWVWEGDSSRRILFFFSLNLQIFSSICLKKFTTFIYETLESTSDLIRSNIYLSFPPNQTYSWLEMKRNQNCGLTSEKICGNLLIGKCKYFHLCCIESSSFFGGQHSCATELINWYGDSI